MDAQTAALLEAAKIGGPVALVLAIMLGLMITERLVPGARLHQERLDQAREIADLKAAGERALADCQTNTQRLQMKYDAALDELRVQDAVNRRVLEAQGRMGGELWRRRR